MSIEAALAELTKAVAVLTDDIRKQNDLNERLIGLKAEAIETVKNTAKPEEKSAKATKAEKPAKAEAAPVEEKPAPAEEPAAEAPAPEAAAPAAPEEPKKLDPIAQAIADYVGGGYDEAHPQAKEERAARSGKVKDIFAAIAKKKGVEVKKHTDIPADMHPSVIKTLANLASQGNLVIKDDAPAAEDEDLLG